MQKEPLVVEGGEILELVSPLVVVIEEVPELVVVLIVIVVIEVSESDGAGQERSGRSSCRFTLEAVPQPAKALPGCLFPAEGSVRIVKNEWEDMELTSHHY